MSTYEYILTNIYIYYKHMYARFTLAPLRVNALVLCVGVCVNVYVYLMCLCVCVFVCVLSRPCAFPL